MHPQMQQVFIKYLMDYYHTKLQGLITTHSNEMVRTVGLSHLRVIRHAGNFKSKLYDLSTLLKDLKKSENLSDKELANFFDWFFEIGYSEIVFADKVIFYEGDTERLFIRKAMTLEKYKKLSQQFLIVGDKSKLQTFEERLQLNYDKGERYFEDKAVPDATIDDIDMDFVKEYTDEIDYGKSPLEYLKENRGFIKEKDGEIQISTAAILLFGKNPQNFFPRARIRFIRYEGTEEKFGTEMNVIKDVIFEGTLLNMINEAIAYLDTQVKEKTYLGSDGTFVTDAEYPKFVRQELIVNAVTHRAYSITGTDIQIKMFDDHIVVESPGKLPGLVRADNIRFTHFSRNPKIAEFLKNYKFVKEFGEGVNRMCNELEQVGLKDLVYHTNAFMLQAVIYNSNVGKTIVEKTAYSLIKLAVAVNKSLIDYQKPAIGEEKSAIDDKNRRLIG